MVDDLLVDGRNGVDGGEDGLGMMPVLEVQHPSTTDGNRRSLVGQL